MVTPNEISFVAGLIVSALFYWQYRRYEAEMKKEEMVRSFLEP